jgi:hypothetical protein
MPHSSQYVWQQQLLTDMQTLTQFSGLTASYIGIHNEEVKDFLKQVKLAWDHVK